MVTSVAKRSSPEIPCCSFNRWKNVGSFSSEGGSFFGFFSFFIFSGCSFWGRIRIRIGPYPIFRVRSSPYQSESFRGQSSSKQRNSAMLPNTIPTTLLFFRFYSFTSVNFSCSGGASSLFGNGGNSSKEEMPIQRRKFCVVP